jgi:hypothetical protein
VDTVRLPAGQPQSDYPYIRVYHFDKVEILKGLLGNPVIKECMYSGMQHLVNDDVGLRDSRI